MCLWYLEFGSVHRYLPSRSIEGGASANMVVHRNLYALTGGFPEEVSRSVDVEFMARCRLHGGDTLFRSGMIVAHRNISGFQHCMRHAESLGQGSARVRTLFKVKTGFSARAPLSILLLFPARIVLMSYRVFRWGRGYRVNYCLSLPGISLALAAWTLGFSRFLFGQK